MKVGSNSGQSAEHYNPVIPGTAWLNNSQTGGSVGSSANGLSTTPGTYTGNNSASRVDGRGDVGGNIGVSYSTGQTSYTPSYRRVNEGRLEQPGTPQGPGNPVIPGTAWLNNSQTGGSVGSSANGLSTTPGTYTGNNSGSRISLRVGVIGGTITGG